MNINRTEVWDIVPTLSGRPKAERNAARVMAFQIYVDDSGSDKSGPVFLLAGCEARADSWAKFSDKWKAELDAEPRVEYFKASECFAMRGQFADMQPEARDAKAQNLAKIIAEHVDRIFVFKVTFEVFDEVFYHQIDSRYDHPYFLMAHDLCEQVLAIYLGERSGEQIEIIFDERQGVSRLISELYSAFRESSVGTERERYFTEVMPSLPIFADERKMMPLQAADMVAWFFRRIFSKEVINYKPGIAWDELRNLNFQVFDADKDFLKARRSEILALLPKGGVYFHQLAKSRKTFDEEISRHNINTLQQSEWYPTLHSFSTRQMRQRQLVKSCTAHDMPHLHTKDGTQCLLEGV